MSKYLIAVGGTGMRCLESFVHLCAIGMMDNKEINVLIIDTDFSGGNKSRTSTIIEKYNQIKLNDRGNGQPLSDSFFSAVINLYKFVPSYEPPKNTFKSIVGNTKINEDLVNLFFEENAQQFDLDHGYRAQTHLGSYLMYDSIIQELENSLKGVDTPAIDSLHAFMDKLTKDGNPEVFVLGSIFGGTGASSIPIIPRALKDAANLFGVVLGNTIFGSTLLTEYFTFNSPNDGAVAAQKVIANSTTFTLNSQAALKYYSNSEIIKSNYQKFYLIGWPDNPKSYGALHTGGSEQKNPAHVVELFCAFAALDFFDNVPPVAPIQWLYRTIAVDLGTNKNLIDFSDFTGNKNADKFKTKLSAFYIMSLMLRNEYIDSPDSAFKKFCEDINATNNKIIAGKITDAQSAALNEYIKYFSFDYDTENSRVIPGWLFEIRGSTNSDVFLFKEDAFSTDYDVLRKIIWGNILPGHYFVKRNSFGIIRRKFSFDTLKTQMNKQLDGLNFDGITKPNERFLKWIYETLKELLNN